MRESVRISCGKCERTLWVARLVHGRFRLHLRDRATFRASLEDKETAQRMQTARVARMRALIERIQSTDDPEEQQRLTDLVRADAHFSDKARESGKRRPSVQNRDIASGEPADKVVEVRCRNPRCRPGGDPNRRPTYRHRLGDLEAATRDAVDRGEDVLLLPLKLAHRR